MRTRLTRRGFTTVELMVVLLVVGVVAGAIAGVLRRQQRFFANASALVEQRVSLRDATGMLPGEIRALSPAAGDVLAFSDSSLDIRATIGAAVACDTVAGGSALNLAPARTGSLAPLVAYATAPQTGDLALIYDARVPDRASDDTWIALDVASVAPVTNVCAASPLIDADNVGAPRLQLRFTSAARVPPSVGPGTYVRILRRVRYRFYRASSGEWYLGYSEWDGSAFGVVQPVSGPFASYSRGGGSGLRLRYFDEQGTELSVAGDATRIARVDVLARGVVRETLSRSGAVQSDSQAVGVRVRNR